MKLNSEDEPPEAPRKPKPVTVLPLVTCSRVRAGVLRSTRYRLQVVVIGFPSEKLAEKSTSPPPGAITPERVGPRESGRTPASDQPPVKHGRYLRVDQAT